MFDFTNYRDLDAFYMIDYVHGFDPDEDPEEGHLDFAPGDHPILTPRQLVRGYVDSWSLENLRSLMNSQKS